MEGSNRSGLQCFEHPNEQITNYCLHFDCLKPLCPDCVETHTKFHQKQEIESWKHCVNKSARSVKSTLDSLRSIYDHQHPHQSIKSVEMIEGQNVRKLHQIKDRIMKMVENTFNDHEQRLRNLIRSQYKIDPPDTTKLKMAIEELEKILMKLGHTTTVLPALKKSLLLDHASLLNYFGNIKGVQKKGVLTETFVYDSSDVSRIRQVLEESIKFADVTNYQSSDNNFGFSDNYYKSPQKDQDTSRALLINKQNYYNSKASHKNLCFFIPSSKELKIVNIDQASQAVWRSTVFKAKSDLPCFFKSIVTPNGDIYLTGGSDENNRLREIYKYNYEKNSLDFICKMNNGRSSHAICYLNNCIYMIGGFAKMQGQISRECEVLKLSTLSCESIASLNAPSANSCAVSFNDSYIFNIGGILNRVECHNLIEMYNVREDRWVVVNIESHRNSPKVDFLSFSAGVQINQKQIFVFGGYDNSQVEKPQRTSFVLDVDPTNASVSIKHFNKMLLHEAEGFWNNNPIIHNGKIFALQNITDRHDELTALADERKVTIFNGDRWI